MPPAKKLKTNAGSSVATLHRFFNGNDRQKQTGAPPLSTNPGTEIIVVDSDEDEVEIVDGPLPHTSPSKQLYPSFGYPTLLEPRKPNLTDIDDEIPNAKLQHVELYTDSPRSAPLDLAIEMDGWGTGDDEMANISSVREEDDEYVEDDAYLPELDSAGAEMKPSLSRLVSNACGSQNAFSVLMSSSSFRENESWKEASKTEDRNIRPTRNNRRKAPFYKVLQGMPIAVDAFRYGKIPNVTAYFLTHAHADHYTNLSSSWKNGFIYCSEGTANLIIHMLSVDKKWVHPLPMDVPTIIPDTGGVSVTLIEANHCPGSCLFFFEGPQTVDAGDSKYKSPYVGTMRTFRYLHCGDFRASPRHVLHPAVQGKRVDHVYLDTTYLDPKYTFPPQSLVISACAELAKRISQGTLNTHKSAFDTWVIKQENPTAKSLRTLFVVGTYSVGKERVLKAIAHALQSKVYCDARKAALLRCQEDDELNDLYTSDPLAANVHLLPLAMITSDRLKTYFQKFQCQFESVVGFRPTGWTYAQAAGTDQMPSIATILSRIPHCKYSYLDLHPSRQSTKSLQIYPVPYSEHSSFFELTCFAMSFDWIRMIATVNVGNESSRRKMDKWISKWEVERRKRGNDIVIPYRHMDYW
ncbi:hypothetical protein APHAL10511_004354 [Amanita phalloides]|nr:hypothetical protein APHAL10511_004354 [Amanita phalloides]